MFHAYLTFRIYFDHRSIRPAVFNSVWRCAQILLLGAILAPGKRTVTNALRVMGLSDERRFQIYQRVLNRAVWSCRQAIHTFEVLFRLPVLNHMVDCILDLLRELFAARVAAFCGEG